MVPLTSAWRLDQPSRFAYILENTRIRKVMEQVPAASEEQVRRIASGDEQAFAALYDHTCGLVHALALRILGNQADADEVTLDVFTQVWRTAGAFRPERGSVLGWLTMVARSRALDRLRSRSSREQHEGVMPLPLDAPTEDCGPEQTASLREQQQRVRAALRALPPEQRQLIELAYYGGLSQSELAVALRQPLGTVKTRVRLGMMKLRETLGQDGLTTVRGA